MTAIERRSEISMSDNALDNVEQPQEQPISIDYQLLKDGRNDELANRRPDFEMQYPISFGEAVSFAFFDRYINNRLLPEDEGILDAIGDQVETLERERLQPGYRDSSGDRPKVFGFKLARFDRYTLEERLKQEKKAEVEKELPQAA